MAEDAETVIEIEGDSEAAVALALTRMLLAAADAPERPTQADILSTFRAALAAVRGEEWIEVEEEFDDEEEGAGTRRRKRKTKTRRRAVAADHSARPLPAPPAGPALAPRRHPCARRGEFRCLLCPRHAHRTLPVRCLGPAGRSPAAICRTAPTRCSTACCPPPRPRRPHLRPARAHGPWRPEEGLLFNPAKLLLDPYATRLRGTFAWNAALLLRTPDGRPDPRDSAPFVPKAVVAGPGPAPAGRGVGGPRVPWERMVIYEAHVKGLTWRHPAVPPALRGRLAALGEPAVIEHLLRLGVTTLELMPIQAFAPTRWQAERGLTQYWGYSPLSFFAAHPPYVAPAHAAPAPAATPAPSPAPAAGARHEMRGGSG